MRGSSKTPAHRRPFSPLSPLEPRFGIHAVRLPFVLCHPHDAQMRATHGTDERGDWVEITRDSRVAARGTFPSNGSASARPVRGLLLFLWSLGFFRDGKRKSGPEGERRRREGATNVRADADE